MDILYCYTTRGAAKESRASAHAAQAAGHTVWQQRMVAVHDYWYALLAAFQRQRAFINLEHDNVLTLDQIAELSECPEPLCAFAYAMHVTDGSDCGRDMLAMGATRFSEELVQSAAPVLARMWPVPYQHVVTPVFYALTYHRPHIYHQHYPNAKHVGNPHPDRTGLSPHIDPEAMRDQDELPFCGTNWQLTPDLDVYLNLVKAKLVARGLSIP